MSRMLSLELRRSAALGAAVSLLIVGALALFFVEGIAFSTGWMQLAMTQRLYLVLLWPLALAAGAWQGRREHRTKVDELFGSTPRPRAQRVVPTLGAMAIGVIGGYLAVGVVGAVWIAGTARYFPAAFLAVTAVGAVALVAAAWLGLAVGRLLPWPVVPPALAVAGLAMLLLTPAATRPRGWLALVFSPIYEMNMPDAYATVPGRVSVAQAVWLVALAAAGVLLFASGGRRLRVAALLPVVLGGALAVAIMPHQNRVVVDAIDPVSRELVCDGEVCVSRVHAGLLSEVAEPAREGLEILAKLPGAPVRVHEDTTTWVPEYFPPASPDVTLLGIEAGPDGHLAERDQVTADVVAGAFKSPPACDDMVPPDDAAAAAHWLIGREPAGDAGAADRWQRLRDLPEAEARARLVAFRQAALACRAGDGLFAR